MCKPILLYFPRCISFCVCVTGEVFEGWAPALFPPQSCGFYFVISHGAGIFSNAHEALEQNQLYYYLHFTVEKAEAKSLM